MRILATAHPSKRYCWLASIASIKLEARFTNNKVKFYEVNGKTEVRLSKESVKSFFPGGIAIADRPFLKKENMDFYAVLYRNKRKYQKQFKALRRKPEK